MFAVRGRGSVGGSSCSQEEVYGVIDASWFAALAVSVAFGAALVVAGGAWFAKQEVC